MIGLILRRIAALPLILFGVAAFTFALVALSPFDPIQAYVSAERSVSKTTKAQIAREWGLNQPPLQQFIIWVGHIVKGDLGYSRLAGGRPVAEVISARLGPSVALVGSALIAVFIGGLTLGTLAAMFRDTWFDWLVRSIAYFMTAAPSFWIALLLLQVFAVQLRLLPAGGISDFRALRSGNPDLRFWILPVLTLAITQQSWFTLFVRNSLLEILREDYVKFSRAQGIHEFSVFVCHALPNALLPFVTITGSHLGELMAGSILIETIFDWPGLGNLAQQAGLSADLPLLLGITLLGSLCVIGGNLLADLSYWVLDPRIREPVK